MSRDLGMAALDPDAAVRVPVDIASRPAGPTRHIDGVAASSSTSKPHALTFAVTTSKPARHSRWRFFLFWCLLKLACRVYPFNFEIYREPEPWETE